MSAEAVIATGALGVSLVALWVGVRAARAAERANSIGSRANDVAVDGNRIARDAADSATAANEIAERAARDAARSADAADASVVVQQREHAAAEAERQSAAKAHVRPVTWETSNRAGPLQGMQFKNYGRAAAREFVGVWTHGASYLSTNRPAIDAGELAVFSTGTKPWTGRDLDPPPRIEPERQVAARAFWENEDGSTGDSGWCVVPRH